jgi:hypothetical protein
MTNEDYSKVPPPHLLKKFSEQAREDSQKRGRPGYCKTFAKLCIDWAFQEAAMDDLRVASAEFSGVELNPKSSPNSLQIRSFDITPPPELIYEWAEDRELLRDPLPLPEYIANCAAQWGAEERMHAICGWLDHPLQKAAHLIGPLLAHFCPKPPSLKRVALLQLDTLNADLGLEGKGVDLSQIRRALEQLDD